MAFQQGLSGLNVSSKALDIVSNNIANASTVGFKQMQGQFADVFAGAFGGGDASQVGLGGNVENVQQLFTQGNVTVTNNPLDISINGSGFFRVQNSVADKTGYFTRNGQFHLTKDGFVQNANGSLLTGYISPDGTMVDTSSVSPIQVNTNGIVPRQTGATITDNPADAGLIIGINLDKRDQKAAAATTTGWTQLAPWNFASLVPGMYNYSTSAEIFDQAGGSHKLAMYFIRQDDAANQNTWNVKYVLDNKYEVQTTSVLDFNANGSLDTSATSLTTTNGRVMLDFNNVKDAAGITWDLAATTPTATAMPFFDPAINGGRIPVNFNHASGGATQFGSSNDVGNIIQDGYASGQLNGVSVTEDGFVRARYSNGQSKVMGQVVLAEFRSPTNLKNIGGNLWIETPASGQPIIGIPTAGTRGGLQAGAVEESNVDLTAELVNMITLQRNYQANAQSIKTQDQILQTLVNLR